MRHAVLGSGGVGGLIGAALARAGEDVVLLMRPPSMARYPGRIAVESAVLGDFEVAIPAAAKLDHAVDALWVATKATGLADALSLAPPERVASGVVVPLLNGIDHVALLRGVYRHVVAAAIRVESERDDGWRIRQPSPFVHVDMGGGERLASTLEASGIACRIRADEVTLLWEKLAFLAPVALATAALAAPLGVVRDDDRFRGCQQETVAVARAEGAEIDDEGLRQATAGAPAEMRSSMQKDVEAGREPELDAIAGPVLRGGERHAIDVDRTASLARMVAAKRAAGS